MEQARVVPVDLLRHFEIDGDLVGIEELKRGHINRTYVGTWEAGGVRHRYVHQVVNHRIFHDIEALMGNLEIVTTALRDSKRLGQLRNDDVTLTLIKTRNGATYLKDEQGEFWRTFEYIENTVTYDVCPSPGVAREAAAILGRFQRALLGVDPGSLQDTIPFFLHGGRRFVAFREAIELNPQGRVSACHKEIEFALSRAGVGTALIEALESSEIPRRVSHCDMKLNNVLFDSSGNRATCLLDLDTCMSGTVLFDFGDLARNTAVPCAEDEQDFSKVVLDMDLYRAICDGYLSEMRGELTRAELTLMPVAPRVLALILGVRFLTDYLGGDTYFRIHRPHQNLERARTQFQIVSLMERFEGEMRAALV
jgi:Ser/Thr protein kinase RdoA (MazF antagonist)